MKRKYLEKNKFTPIPLGKIHPKGWLYKQLRVQAEGLSGHLDEFWPLIKDSMWLGGKIDSWEVVPYWLDGIVPLTYLLQDKKLISKAEKAIDHILSHQREDGWIGPYGKDNENVWDLTGKPSDEKDSWSVFPVLKALIQYYEATNDERVIPAIEKWFIQFDHYLNRNPLYHWAQFRWQEVMVSLYWLYGKIEKEWLLKLANRIKRMGYDWLAYFMEFPNKGKRNKWAFDKHVVNHAMAIKISAIIYRLWPEKVSSGLAKKIIETMDKYHGQATGVFSGDESLAGKMPSQGTELCSVVEYMYSLEVLLSTFGDPFIGDRLEKIAFNALPATFTPDMWAHQYDQQVNQVICCDTGDINDHKNRVYTCNDPRSNLFGLEPNYFCCAANMHQGWPKFASHLWMRTDDGGFAAVILAPGMAEDKIGNVGVKIELNTDYPFTEELKFIVTVDKPIKFPLKIRIPEWAVDPAVVIKGNKIKARPGEFHCINKLWKGTSEIKVKLPMKVKLDRRYNNSVAINRGPLVYSLKIGEEWKKIPPADDLFMYKKDKEVSKKYLDSEIYPVTPWNYALDINEYNPESSIKFKTRRLDNMPFSPEGAPIEARVKGRKIPKWKIHKNAAAEPPLSPVNSEEGLEELTLIPYGSTNLRITEFPMLGKNKGSQ